MVSILKRIVKRFSVKGLRATSERVFVAAFGKHPGWDDHIDDIGVETDTLIAVKRILYVNGIGGNIDSGSWDKLQEDQRAEEFKHIFVWCMGNKVVVGRMWSSRDGKGRTSYPMVVCVQCAQLTLEWIFETILPRLETAEKLCTGTISAADVQTALENLREELRSLAKQNQSSKHLLAVCPDALARLIECPEMKSNNHQGFLRILYHIEREVTGHYPNTTNSNKDLRPTLLRVPVSLELLLERVVLWISFLLTRFSADTPVLILMPLGKSWMDIIIGEPTATQLYCLRALPEAVPLTVSVPYNMDSEFIERANRLIEDSRSLGR